MPFVPNRRFRRDYDRIFRKNPLVANTFLLLCELANEKGQVVLPNPPEKILSQLMETRFHDPRAYQLPRGPKR